jgi:ArsR family transcriptional regulator
MRYGIGEYAVVFKALGDETRLKILTMLTRKKTCACILLDEFNFTQPTLSYHMKQLTDCGIVDSQKVGKWVFYSINSERLELLCEFLDQVNETNNEEGCCACR